MREIAFDTETTGLDWAGDDRIIEVGAVEMINHIATGESFRMLINPGRAVSQDTIRITGITDADLVDAPPFASPDVVDALMAFFGDSTIVAHNAAFDRGFLNRELERCGRPGLPEDRWVDSAALARQKHPGAPASLDALCRRYDVSLESRSFHGALLDAQLLAKVYVELRGGRERRFDFVPQSVAAEGQAAAAAKSRHTLLSPLLNESERRAHDSFVAGLGENSVWRRIAN